ncbi:MAG: YfcE family phosphodiesterase [Candidatus Dojkabacteria bacterium]
MKILVVSDSHDNFVKLKAAIDKGNAAKCEVMLHAGDLIAPTMVKVISEFKGVVHFVWGNNEGEKVGVTKKISEHDNVFLEGDTFDGEFDGIRVYMSHYEDKSRPKAQSGKYELCIYGHDHTYNAEVIGETLLLNPGALMGWGEPPTFVIFDTEDRSVEKIEI